MGCSVSCASVSACYFFISKPVYTSSVTFYTDYTDSDSLSLLNPFLEKLDGENSDLSFSVSDYVESDKFLNDIIQEKYEIDGISMSLIDYWGNSKNPIVYFSRFNRSLMFEKTVYLCLQTKVLWLLL